VLSLAPSWRTDPYDRFALPFAEKRISAGQIWDILRQFPQVTLGAFAQLLKPDRLVSTFVLESKPEQAPNRDSRVVLERERDPFGLNRARLEWRLKPIDRRTVVRAEELIDAELRRLGIGRLAPLPSELREAWPEDFSGGWHQIGTTRAHADPRHGVVDTHCRVHGVANLFVAGASVFPTGGAVSPTPTVLALALRLADHLKAMLR
jgi:choline dehydrogenase-like flavoprotein